ncbi:uncharacterized protein LOC134167179, partial [Pezoporus occidentalis]|uniref:uncharacterized protein LOC134167179 n=1 Tax=Pezoporus occidentalis TaxID=407982 RepID=UPI002F91B635
MSQRHQLEPVGSLVLQWGGSTPAPGWGGDGGGRQRGRVQGAIQDRAILMRWDGDLHPTRGVRGAPPGCFGEQGSGVLQGEAMVPQTPQGLRTTAAGGEGTFIGGPKPPQLAATHSGWWEHRCVPSILSYPYPSPPSRIPAGPCALGDLCHAPPGSWCTPSHPLRKWSRSLGPTGEGRVRAQGSWCPEGSRSPERALGGLAVTMVPWCSSRTQGSSSGSTPGSVGPSSPPSGTSDLTSSDDSSSDFEATLRPCSKRGPQQGPKHSQVRKRPRVMEPNGDPSSTPTVNPEPSTLFEAIKSAKIAVE